MVLMETINKSRPAAPLVERLEERLRNHSDEWPIELINLVAEAATALSLAQTEIKGHMRIEDDLKRDLEEMTISNRYHAEDSLKHLHRAEAAEARIAELEKDAARYRWLRREGATQEEALLFTGETMDRFVDAALKDRA